MSERERGREIDPAKAAHDHPPMRTQTVTHSTTIVRERKLFTDDDPTRAPTDPSIVSWSSLVDALRHPPVHSETKSTVESVLVMTHHRPTR